MIESRVKSQESRVKSQDARCQISDTRLFGLGLEDVNDKIKNQESRTKNQESRANMSGNDPVDLITANRQLVTVKFMTTSN